MCLCICLCLCICQQSSSLSYHALSIPHIQKGEFCGFRNPQIIIYFPQRDCYKKKVKSCSRRYIEWVRQSVIWFFVLLAIGKINLTSYPTLSLFFTKYNKDDENESSFEEGQYQCKGSDVHWLLLLICQSSIWALWVITLMVMLVFRSGL